jgi:hypothetical protein
MATTIVNTYTSFPATGSVGGWVEVGRTTLACAGDTITVSCLADKRYYMVLTDIIPCGNVREIMRVNSAAGTSYSHRDSANGAADAIKTSRCSLEFGKNSEATTAFSVGYWSNLSSHEKTWINHEVRSNTAGASNAPTRSEHVGKWTNTCNAINRFDVINDQGGDFAAGSEVVILAWDPTDIHTCDFWEELASVDLSGGTATSLSTGTFTTKKYLWVQMYIEPDGATNQLLRYGNGSEDTGSNYSYRQSDNGTADTTDTSIGHMNITEAATSLPWFWNGFIINNTSNEKLTIGHMIQQSTAGAGTAPNREEYTGKWANTSNQLNLIKITGSGGDSVLGTNTIIKVWGSD